MMKREYDFSRAVGGKFYREGAELRLPISLDATLQRQLERIARKKGREIGDVVNQLVKKEAEGNRGDNAPAAGSGRRFFLRAAEGHAGDQLFGLRRMLTVMASSPVATRR
jgi:hypothetical protein